MTALPEPKRVETYLLSDLTGPPNGAVRTSAAHLWAAPRNFSAAEERKPTDVKQGPTVPRNDRKVRSLAREVVAHYGGDDLHAMPWSRHMMVSDDLRQWLKPRRSRTHYRYRNLRNRLLVRQCKWRPLRHSRRVGRRNSLRERLHRQI